MNNNMKAPSVSDDKKKKDKDRKAVKDDFYDRRNYYEERNIFSSNEAFNPGNRLYTNQASSSHGVWDSMKSKPHVVDFEMHADMERNANLASGELAQTLVSNIAKKTSFSGTGAMGCRKCGIGKILFLNKNLFKFLVGHLPYQCMNNVKLKSLPEKNVNDQKLANVQVAYGRNYIS
jgi:hypothetical protein